MNKEIEEGYCDISDEDYDFIFNMDKGLECENKPCHPNLKHGFLICDKCGWSE